MAWICFSGGEARLEKKDGKLVWSRGDWNPPDAGEVTLWDGAVDENGLLHMALFTQSRHLLYCSTPDGKRWRRQALSRVDRSDVRMTALVMGNGKSVFYLLEGEGVPAAVHLSCPSPEQWQARRWALPEGSVSLGPMGRKTPWVYGEREGKTCFWQDGRVLAAFPGTVTGSFSLAGHLLVCCGGRVYADGLYLGEGDGPLGLQEQDGLTALWQKEGRWVQRRLGEHGWQEEEPLAGIPELCLSGQGKEMRIHRRASLPQTPVKPPADRLAQLEARIAALEARLR